MKVYVQIQDTLHNYMYIHVYVCTYFCWRSEHSSDSEQRVNLTASWEEWSEGVGLIHDAPHRPQVNGAAVVGGLEHDLRGTIPGGGGGRGKGIQGNTREEESATYIHK